LHRFLVQHRTSAAFALLLLLVPSAWAAGSAEWRFWDSDDGLSERFVATISREATGTLWITHGDVRFISRFDGKSIVRIPTPYSNNGRRFDSFDGKNGWAAEEDGLRHLQDGKWQLFPELKLSVLTPARQHVPDFHVLDLGNSEALVLFSDHLAKFSALTRRLQPVPLSLAGSRIGRLTTFERGPDGSVWVAAEKGIARLGYPSLSWQEYPIGNLPVEDLSFPVACPGGEFFLTAALKNHQERVILRLQNEAWEMIRGIPKSMSASLAWRDAAGNLWLASDVLYRKSALNPEDGWVAVDSSSAILSGKVYTVVVNPDGSFFMATSYGLALHVNRAWKPFIWARGSHGNRIELKRQLTALLEDRRQRLWFLAEHSLLRFYQGHWEEYSLPPESVIDTNQRNSLAELPNGRILIQLQEAPYLISFDPETERMARVKLIEGYKPVTFCRRPDGRILVAMDGMDGRSGALAILDGRAALFAMTGVPANWDVHYPRGMLETAGGEVWVGGTAGLVRFAGGRQQRFDWIEAPQGGIKSKIPLQVFSMLADSRNGFLIGARQLLCRWTGKRLEVLSDSPLVEDIARDRDGTLWLGTTTDVRRLLRLGDSATAGPGPAWSINGVMDGLPMAAGNAVLRDSAGRLWAITDKGPAIFQPGVDSDPPDAVIRADQNSGEALSSGEFRVIFTGRDKWDMTPPEALEYSYRLDHKSWSPLSKATVASFHNLFLGKHEFEVIAIDRQGNVDAKPALLKFSVAAPWYSTTGFRVIAAAALATIIYLLSFGAYQYRMRGKLMRAAEKLAYLDVLTGLPNRRMFNEFAGQLLNQQATGQGYCALLMIDLDRFKHINDSFGHDAGDALLKETAARLVASVRKTDCVARLGGDEFAILLSGRCTEADINGICRRIIASFVEGIPFNGVNMMTSPSVGVALFPDGGQTQDSLCKSADLALYAAKHAGKNTWRWYKPEMASEGQVIDAVATRS
jgi:diguanylate cyclase (GGDEF)-like protein